MFMRFDPFREFDRLTEDLVSGGRARSLMPMDAYRKDEQFIVHFDLPGVDPDSIDLTVEKNMLTVKAERIYDLGEGTDILFSERPQGSFSRRVYLGEALDVDNLDARYNNGVLTVVIPVAESAKPRKVEISAGGSPKAIEAEASAA